MSFAAPERRLDQALDDVTRLLEKHRVLTTFTHRQEGPKRDLLEQLHQRRTDRAARAVNRSIPPISPTSSSGWSRRWPLIWQQPASPRGAVLGKSRCRAEAPIEATCTSG
jgi:hypothetical protein